MFVIIEGVPHCTQCPYLAVNIRFQSEEATNEDRGGVDDTGRNTVGRVGVNLFQN